MTRRNFEARIRELVAGQATLERIAGAMLSARSALKAEYGGLHKAVLATVRDDAVCSRLMTVPGVGPLVVITCKSAIDDPHRIAKSKAAGALFRLTPKKYQSGEKDVTGGITMAGDEMVRTVLCGNCVADYIDAVGDPAHREHESMSICGPEQFDPDSSTVRRSMPPLMHFPEFGSRGPAPRGSNRRQASIKGAAELLFRSRG